MPSWIGVVPRPTHTKKGLLEQSEPKNKHIPHPVQQRERAREIVEIYILVRHLEGCSPLPKCTHHGHGQVPTSLGWIASTALNTSSIVEPTLIFMMRINVNQIGRQKLRTFFCKVGVSEMSVRIVNGQVSTGLTIRTILLSSIRRQTVQ